MATGNYGSLTYTYDNVGNRQTKVRTGANPVQDTYVYTVNTNLLDAITGTNAEDVTHDADGNMTVRVPEGPHTITSNSETIYCYDQFGQLIAETTATGTLIKAYVWLNGQPLAMIEGGSMYYYHNDHLGTPQKITDATGAVVWSADYLPFGKADVTIQTVKNNLRFKGQYFDEDTGLHYNYHRYYDPGIGRYLRADPIGLAGGINLYTYVLNNPVNFIDPLGLFSWGFGGTLGPATVSWDSAHPTQTNISVTSDFEVGGGISLTFDHPFPDANSTKLPVDINLGSSKWFGISTDGTKFSIKLGLGAGLTPIDISKGKDYPEDECP